MPMRTARRASGLPAVEGGRVEVTRVLKRLSFHHTLAKRRVIALMYISFDPSREHCAGSQADAADAYLAMVGRMLEAKARI